MTDNRLVKDYLRDWFPTHAARHSAAHPAYPAVGTPEYTRLYSDWFDELKRNNVDGDEAEAASKSLLTHKDAAFRNNHLRLLLDYVEAARKAKLEAPPILAGSREAAEVASRACPDCDGSGYAKRARRDGLPFTVTTRAGVDHESATIVAACRCAYGRWLLAAAHKDHRPVDVLAIEAATISYDEWYLARPRPEPLDRRPRPTPTIRQIFSEVPPAF